MHDSWVCLSVERGPNLLPQEVIDGLRRAACTLYAKRFDQMHIDDELMRGSIETEWRSHLIGTRSGILFRARIDCTKGEDYRVNFLYSEDDLKRGAECMLEEGIESGTPIFTTARLPVDELYEFPGPVNHSKRVH